MGPWAGPLTPRRNVRHVEPCVNAGAERRRAPVSEDCQVRGSRTSNRPAPMVMPCSFSLCRRRGDQAADAVGGGDNAVDSKGASHQVEAMLRVGARWSPRESCGAYASAKSTVCWATSYRLREPATHASWGRTTCRSLRATRQRWLVRIGPVEHVSGAAFECRTCEVLAECPQCGNSGACGGGPCPPAGRHGKSSDRGRPGGCRSRRERASPYSTGGQVPTSVRKRTPRASRPRRCTGRSTSRPMGTVEVWPEVTRC